MPVGANTILEGSSANVWSEALTLLSIAPAATLKSVEHGHVPTRHARALAQASLGGEVA
jgi:hypothetical protein